MGTGEKKALATIQPCKPHPYIVSSSAAMQQQQTSRLFVNSTKQLQTHTKCLEMFTEMKHHLVCMSLNGLERNARTVKMILGVGSHQLLKNLEQLQDLANSCAQSVPQSYG
jgi:hypothetical protein